MMAHGQKYRHPESRIPADRNPLELPGRNSSTYGDGDIPEIDLPGADNATHDFPQEFPENCMQS